MSGYSKKTVQSVFGHNWRNKKGDVGIEIEVEGGPWPADQIGNWVTHQDGSLRNNGIEYVLRNPVNVGEVRKQLTTLKTRLEEARAHLDFSQRTSVHVHVNVQHMTIPEWLSFICLFTLFDEALTDVVGPNRGGNRFCLRMVDADGALRFLRDALRQGNLPNLLNTEFKYGSMNVWSTARLGTIEFRAMEGNLDVDRITAWCETLVTLRDRCVGNNDATSIITQMSQMTPVGFARFVLPDNIITRPLFERPHHELTEMMYEGARICQDLAYVESWADEPEERIEPDFGVPQQPRDWNDALAGLAALDNERRRVRPRRIAINDNELGWANLNIQEDN